MSTGGRHPAAHASAGPDVLRTEADLQRADHRLLRHGHVTLFRRRAILDEARDALRALAYATAEVSCRSGLPEFRRQLPEAPNWEAQFGYSPWNGNLNVVNDGIGGLTFGPSGRGALVLDGFHALVRTDRDTAHALLDGIEGAGRDHLLAGRLFVALVQTDDPRFASPALGARPATWNDAEWLDGKRGP